VYQVAAGNRNYSNSIWDELCIKRGTPSSLNFQYNKKQTVKACCTIMFEYVACNVKGLGLVVYFSEGGNTYPLFALTWAGLVRDFQHCPE
jgi:hypothetical protein